MKQRWMVFGVLVLLVGGGLLWRSLRQRRHQPDFAAGQTRIDRPPSVGTPAQPFDTQIRERSGQIIKETMRNDPNRLSTSAALPPFDPQSFDADPERYLSRLEPARCFQTREPGRDVPRLQAEGSLRAALAPGQDVPLLVKVPPWAPVTFTSFGGGAFRESAVATVTVRADARGVAMVHFVATAGMGGEVPIVVGSPMAAGNLRYWLRVQG